MLSQKKVFILLSVIFLIGAFLRLNNFTDNFFFGHDQARDIHEIHSIVNLHNLKIVGPGTDIPGLFSGPIYYYLLSPVYYFFDFNPNAVVILLSLINLSAIFLLYFFGKQLVNDFFGLTASFLWVVSFEQANFSRFISNPSFLSITSIIFFLGCYLFFVRKKSWGLTVSIIGFSLATQLDFYLVYLFVFYLIFYLIYKPMLNRKTVLLNLTLLIILLSSFLIAEIKFDFIGIRSLFKYLGAGHNYSDVMSNTGLYFSSLSKSFYNSGFSFSQTSALVFYLIAIGLFLKTYKSVKNKLFLICWSFSTLPLFFFRSNVVGGNFIHSSIHGATTLIFAYFIYYWTTVQKKFISVILITVILVMNLNLFIKDGFTNSFLLGHQPMVYKNQKDAVDYTYKSTNKNQFSICSISNPLFINVLWSAVYKFYGEKKYGYIPYWSGPKQEDLTKTFLPYDKNHQPVRYLIIEPGNQLPEYAIKTTILIEDKTSYIVESKKFGEIIVQKRFLTKNKNQLRDSQNLSEGEKKQLEFIANKDYRYSCFYENY